MRTSLHIARHLLIFTTRCRTALLFIVLVTAAAAAQRQTDSTRTQKRQEESSRKTAPLTVEEIQEARKLLGELGYWVDASDESLRYALIAFQKIEGRRRTGILTKDELEALRTAEAPIPLEEGYPHIEVDLHRQVLFAVECGEEPLLILPISSGSGEWYTEGETTQRAITPTGRFKISRKIAGWRKSPLGLLYYPSYIHGGIAIHGSPFVPARPASHGCIRIPMFAAEEFSQMAVIGMEVIVYDDFIP